MSRPVWRSTVTLAAGLALAVGCGKRGDPLPPLRPVPGPVGDFRARRAPDGVELSFTIPPSNADGTTPAAADRVDVFARTLPADAAAITGQQLSADPANLIGRVTIRRGEAADAGADDGLGPGDRAVLGDRVEVTEVPSVRYYTAVGIAGPGSGREGRPTAVLTVPLTALPLPPATVTLGHDERELQVGWEPAEEDLEFQVFRVDQSVTPLSASNLTPTPVTGTAFGLPVEFGRELCVAVVAVQVAGPVTAQGPPSPVECIVPVDSYPPLAPAGLQVVQDGTAVALLWSAVDTADLAGYIVLRGEGTGDDLQPLFLLPQVATTFRDATVDVGVTYTYAVYAVDRAAEPNVSQLSPRRVVTVR